MAEAVGLITSLIGGCDVILRASIAITRLISAIKDAPKALQNLKNEIENLEAIVSALKGFLDSSKARRHKFVTASPIATIINQCETFVTELKRDFEADSTKPRALWVLGSKEHYRAALQDLNRYTTMFQIGLSLDGWSLLFKSSEEALIEMRTLHGDLQRVIKVIEPIKEMKTDVADWKNHVKAIEEAIEFCKRAAVETDAVLTVEKVVKRQNEVIEAKLRVEEKIDLLDFLSRANFQNKHLDIAKIRHEKTGSWILNNSSFKRWIQPCPKNTSRDHTSREGSRVQSTLWCHGVPGAGKTVIFSRLVDYLKQEQGNLDIVVAAVYLSHNNPSLHSADQILLGLLRHIAEALYDAHAEVRLWLGELKFLCQGPPERNLLSDDCIRLFQKLTTVGKSFVLCFDGLDELPEYQRRNLYRMIVSLASLPRIKLLLMSRSSFSMGTLPHQELHVSAQVSDLRIYLTSKFQEIHEKTLQNAPVEKARSLRNFVVDKIIATSKGMFLLPNLQVRQLETATSIREIEDVVNELPEELEEQYEIYMTRLKLGSHAKLAMNALKWVAFSCRPLTSDEVVEALAVRSNDSDRDETGFTAIETIIEACEGLVANDRNANDVRLVHETLQDFLDKNKANHFEKPHLSILTTIATYLKFKPFTESSSTITDNFWFKSAVILNEYKLTEYCFRYWGYHVKQAGTMVLPVALQITEIISKSESLLRFITFLRILPLPLFEAQKFTPLHVATLWGIKTLVPSIMGSNEFLLNEKSLYGFTPLHVAAITGDFWFVEEFIKLGGDIYAQDNQGRMPIHLAAAFGNSLLIPLLITPNVVVVPTTVDVTEKQYFMSPLHVAIANRHLVFMESLLAHGVDPNTTIISSGQSALHYAFQFCPDAVQPLLNCGASISSISNNGRSCLHWACLSGSISPGMRKVLQGQSPEAQDSDQCIALHILSGARQACISTAMWLIELGSDINSRDKDGKTPLYIALCTQNFGLADILVTEGSDADTVSHDGSMPALIAAQDEKCPESLLIELTKPIRPGQDTLLHRAVSRGKADEVYGLLRCKLNVNVQNDQGETPLHIAARFNSDRRHSTIRKSRSDVVSLLLSNGAKPDVQSQTGLTAIQIAVIRDSLTSLCQMLDPSIESNWQKSETLPDGSSLLVYAANHSSVSCFHAIFVYMIRSSQCTNDSTLLNTLINQLRGSESVIVSNEMYRIVTALTLTFNDDYEITKSHIAPSTDDEINFCQASISHNMPCGRFSSLSETICIVASHMPDNQRQEVLLKTQFEDWYKQVTQNRHSFGHISPMENCQMILEQTHEALTQPSDGSVRKVPDFALEWRDDLPLSSSRRRSSHYNFRGPKSSSLMYVPRKEPRMDPRRPTLGGPILSRKQLRHINHDRELKKMGHPKD